MKATRTSPGFTLIETILYMGLYAIVMGGSLVAVYSIFETSGRNETRAMVQEEGDFLVGKLDWALTGITSIDAPAPNASGQTLQVTKADKSTGTVDISIVGTTMTLTRDGTTYTLNNSNVRVSGAPFIKHVRASTDGINPESVTAQFTLTATTTDGFVYSQSFETTKYVRK